MSKVNRNKTLKNIHSSSPKKAKFPLAQTKKLFPNQLIRLYASSFKNDFPGQILKEFEPKEYLKQKQKLQVSKNLRTRKYNKKPKSRPGSSSGNISMANLLERWESGAFR